MYAAGGALHAQRWAVGGGELSSDHADGECGEQCRGECDQHGDGERGRGHEREE